MKYLILFFFLVGCSAVKRVNRDPEKQLRVVDDYFKKNPLKSDTVIRIIEGDTITEIINHSDTAYLVDSIFVEGEERIKVITKTNTIYKTRVDTMKITVYDRQKEKAYEGIIVQKDRDISNYQGQIKGMKRDKRTWMWLFIVLLALNAIIFGIKLATKK